MVKVDFREIKPEIVKQPKEKLEELKKIVPKVVSQRVQERKIWLEVNTRKIKTPPQDVQEYVA